MDREGKRKMTAIKWLLMAPFNLLWWILTNVLKSLVIMAVLAGLFYLVARYVIGIDVGGLI